MLGMIIWAVVLTCITILFLKKLPLAKKGKILSQSGSNDNEKKIFKGPKPFPLIGSLHLLRGSSGPFAAFTQLAKQYGDIYEIQLGVAKCVVVSSYSLLKEVLITKGHQFGGRPDFLRFHQLFGGDRNNCK